MDRKNEIMASIGNTLNLIDEEIAERKNNRNTLHLAYLEGIYEDLSDVLSKVSYFFDANPKCTTD